MDGMIMHISKEQFKIYMFAYEIHLYEYKLLS